MQVFSIISKYSNIIVHFSFCFAPLPRRCLTEIINTDSKCDCEAACKNWQKLEQWICCVPKWCTGNMSLWLITLQTCIHHVVNYLAERTPLQAPFSNYLPAVTVGSFILHLCHLFGRPALRPDALVAVSGLSDTHLLNHSYKLFRLAWRLFIGSECQIWQKVPSGGACQDLVKPWQVKGNVAWGWPVGGEMDLRIKQPSLDWAVHLDKYLFFYQLTEQWMHSVLYILHGSLLSF